MSVAVKRLLDDGLEIAYVTGSEIDYYWSEILPGLDMALEKSHREVTADDVLSAVRDGSCVCWMASDGERLRGLVIGEPMTTAKGITLNLPFAWVDSNVVVLNRLMSIVEEHAKAAGWRAVKFYSSVPTFGSWAKRRGYGVRFVEYFKEI